MNLMQAHREWATRPQDERVSTLKELHERVTAVQENCVTSTVVPSDLKFVTANNGLDIAIQGKQSIAVPTHWAFSQLCQLTDAPTAWLRKCPAELVAGNLNYAAQTATRTKMSMMWRNHEEVGKVRCFTTMTYSRLWDSSVVSLLREMTADETNGWHRPPAITDEKYPSGYYVSDRNFFVFMVNDQNKLDDGKKGLGRGFFCWNTEVGQMSFGLKAFLYEYVCGNHIVWGGQELFDLRMWHSGRNMTARAQSELSGILNAYLSQSPKKDQLMIDAARLKTIAASSRESSDWLMTNGFRKIESDAIVSRVENNGEDPTILWNLVYAATELNKNIPYADERSAADKRAGNLLNVVF